MAAVRTLTQRSSLIAIRSHVAFTFRRLQNHPLTGELVPRFKALLDDWPVRFQAELDLNDRIDDGQVAIVIADDKLNRFADRTSKEILTITGEDRTHPLYLHYFGNKPLHVFKRPLLGSQLEAMRKWILSLQESEHAVLRALAAVLIALIAEADQAVREKATAEQELANSRDVGDRKRTIDQVNAARKEVYGVLSTFPHKYTGLPSSFADGFFRRSRVKGEEEEEPTIESVEEAIAALKAELAAKEEALAALQKQAKDAAAEEEQRAATRAKLAAVQAEIAAKQKEADALEAELGPDAVR